VFEKLLFRICPEKKSSFPKRESLILLNSSRLKICSSVRPMELICSPNITDRIVSWPSSITIFRRARFCGCSPLFLSSSVNFFPVSGFTSK